MKKATVLFRKVWKFIVPCFESSNTAWHYSGSCSKCGTNQCVKVRGARGGGLSPLLPFEPPAIV